MRFRVLVLRDLTRGLSPEIGKGALKIVSLHLELVVESELLITKWREEGMKA